MAQEDYDPKYREWKRRREFAKRGLGFPSKAVKDRWLAKKRAEADRLAESLPPETKCGPNVKIRVDRKMYYRTQSEPVSMHGSALRDSALAQPPQEQSQDLPGRASGNGKPVAQAGPPRYNVETSK